MNIACSRERCSPVKDEMMGKVPWTYRMTVEIVTFGSHQARSKARARALILP